MSCVLHIKGENFNVDDFINSTGIKTNVIYRKGETKKNGKAVYKTSGCSIVLSEADFDQFELQKREAVKFLTEEFEKLNAVYSFGLKDFETPTIDFGIYTRMQDLFSQSDYFEPSLLKLAGELNFGIEISQYHSGEEE